jgi:hypothetical protein
MSAWVTFDFWHGVFVGQLWMFSTILKYVTSRPCLLSPGGLGCGRMNDTYTTQHPSRYVRDNLR